MGIWEHNDLYHEDIENVIETVSDWDFIKGKTILITGATGMIGSFLIDVLMSNNLNIINNEDKVKIIATGRNSKKAEKRFKKYWTSPDFSFIELDINKSISNKLLHTDLVFHAASNTHPVAYATDPIGTITANVIGTYNLLNFAKQCGCQRFVFASSNEIYGENRGDVDCFKEDYCGYIDSNSLRAGYPESKRCGEALCQAFIKQEQMDIVIARFTRTYGPTLLKSDTKALSQFIHNGVNNEDIILKSEGNQVYSYIYVADAVSALLTIMKKGSTGEAYNISDKQSDIKLKDLANIIARISNTKVVFDLPSDTEKEGFSKVTKALLDSSKLKSLGWNARYDIESGIARTIKMIREAENEEK